MDNINNIPLHELFTRYNMEAVNQKNTMCTYPGVLKNKYIVSITGDLFSIHYSRFLIKQFDKNGYIRYHMATDTGYKNIFAHRLVAWEFVINPNPELYNLVNHLDGVKENIYFTNLEWCSNSYNKYHAKINGLTAKGESHGYSKYMESDIKEICELFQAGYSKPQVLEYFKCNFKNNRSLYDLIFLIYNKRAWNHITCQYNY